MKKKRIFGLWTLVIISLTLLTSGLGSLATTSRLVNASNFTVCPTGPPICDYSSIQAAVDAASSGDVIKVATGTYTGVSEHPAPVDYKSPPADGNIVQLVYIDKELTIRGGYNTAFTEPPDPNLNPTILDAQELGRVLFLTGNIASEIEGFHITGGNSVGLGGHEWAPHAGGGVYVHQAQGFFQGNKVFGNESYAGGGIFVADSPQFTIQDNNIFANKVVGSYSHGAGILVYQSVATLEANEVTDNIAGHVVGAIHLVNSEAKITENIISDNESNNGTGGIQLEESIAVIEANLISRNNGRHGGIGIVNNSEADIASNTILSNTTLARWGGGIYLDSDSEARIHNNTISGNYDSGLYFSFGWRRPGFVVRANDIIENDGVGLYSARSGTIDGNTITDNSGTGILSYGDEITITNNIITYNSGGVDAGGFNSLFVSGNSITHNIRDEGGGINIENRYNYEFADAVLHNNLIANNEVTDIGGRGSGLFIVDASVQLLHNTISGNYGGLGSGIYVTTVESDYNAVELVNNVIVSHTFGLYVQSDSLAMVDNNLWGSGDWANTYDWFGEGTILTGTNNVWADPGFVNPQQDDYHLMPGSAAIDAGANVGVNSDFDNQPRPFNVPDIGADEYWPPGALKFAFLPIIISQP